MLKKICMCGFSAVLGMAAVSANAAQVILGGSGSDVKVVLVTASTMDASAATAFAGKERVQVILHLPSDTLDTTLQDNCGYNFIGPPSAGLIVAIKPWYPLVPSSSTTTVSQEDHLKQTQYNNILSMASSASLSQVDVWVGMDNVTCEIDTLGLAP